MRSGSVANADRTEHESSLRDQLRNPLSDVTLDALLMVLTITLDVEEMLAIDYRRTQNGDMPYRPFVIAHELASDAKTDSIIGQRLHTVLSEKLRWAAKAFAEHTIGEFADLWVNGKHTLSGTRLAGLLWTIAQSQRIGYRKLEGGLLNDLKYRAFESLSRPAHQTIISDTV